MSVFFPTAGLGQVYRPNSGLAPKTDPKPEQDSSLQACWGGGKLPPAYAVLTPSKQGWLQHRHAPLFYFFFLLLLLLLLLFHFCSHCVARSFQTCLGGGPAPHLLPASVSGTTNASGLRVLSPLNNTAHTSASSFAVGSGAHAILTSTPNHPQGIANTPSSPSLSSSSRHEDQQHQQHQHQKRAGRTWVVRSMKKSPHSGQPPFLHSGASGDISGRTNASSPSSSPRPGIDTAMLARVAAQQPAARARARRAPQGELN